MGYGLSFILAKFTGVAKPGFQRTMVLIAAMLAISGCAYRFTNKAMQPPEGIRSIAVEAVYDTSREVIPHQLLWDALQKAIAQNGKLRLTSQADADALLRAHITKAKVVPTGTPAQRDNRAKDPEIPDVDEPTEYRDYSDISKAGRYTTVEALQYTVTVEVWNLHTQKLIKSKAYNASTQFKSIRGTNTDPKAGYLVYDEALQARFQEISKNIAEKAVFDVLF